jgi:hypothetical protein
MRYFTLLLFIFLCHHAVSQKLMMAPDYLLVDTDPLFIRLKKGGMKFIYEAGTYQLSPVKGSYSGTSLRTEGVSQSLYNRLTSRREATSAKEDGSYFFTGAEGDSAIIHYVIQTTLYFDDPSKGILNTKSRNEPREYLGGTLNYIASIIFKDDTTEWILETVIQENPQSLFEADTFEGLLTNNERRISLKAIYKFQNGKKRFPGMPKLGVVFEENGTALAAVQLDVPGAKVNVNDTRAWISTEQDSKMKMIFAAASVLLKIEELRLNNSTLKETLPPFQTN